MIVSRTHFIAAIEAGIAHARSKGLCNEDEADRLRAVGRNAVAFDTNFAPDGEEGILNCGCPASQAGLRNSGLNNADWEFACGFDDEMGKLIDREHGTMSYARVFRVEVV